MFLDTIACYSHYFSSGSMLNGMFSVLHILFASFLAPIRVSLSLSYIPISIPNLAGLERIYMHWVGTS